MIEEVGVICAIEKNNASQTIWVETQIKSTCGSCEAQANCGTGAIAKVFARKPEKLHFRFDQTVSIGQKVKLGIPEENLLKASMLVYLVPLLVLVASALIGQWLLPQIGLLGEPWLMLFSAVSTLASFKVVQHRLNANKNSDYYPQLLGVLPPNNPNIPIKQL